VIESEVLAWRFSHTRKTVAFMRVGQPAVGIHSV